MAVKVQILRCNHLIDIVSVSEDKLREVRDILQSRKMREEATRLKDTFLGVSVAYKSPTLEQTRLLSFHSDFGSYSTMVSSFCVHRV